MYAVVAFIYLSLQLSQPQHGGNDVVAIQQADRASRFSWWGALKVPGTILRRILVLLKRCLTLRTTLRVPCVLRRGLKGSLSLVRGSLMQFIREHISEPFWGIYNDLVHNKPLTMTDANALADTSYRCTARFKPLAAGVTCFRLCLLQWLCKVMANARRVSGAPAKKHVLAVNFTSTRYDTCQVVRPYG